MLEADSSAGIPPQVRLGASIPQVFETFYEANYHRVVALAVALSGDRVDAEDLAQEAFSAAHDRWTEIAGYDNPDAWVFRVVANKAVSSFRRRRNETKGLRSLGPPRSSGLPFGIEHRAELWAAVRGLPDRQAQAVALFYIGDRSVAAVAELMELSEGTVKAHLSRARRTLADQLGIKEDE